MTDFTRPFIDVLVDMIVDKNPSVALDNTMLTILSVNEAAGLSGGRNTVIRVEANEGSGLYGEDEFYYIRIDIADIVATQDGRFELGTRTKLSDLMEEFNTRFGLNLTADDYEDVEFPAFENLPGEEKTITFTAKPGSYWIHGSVELTIYNEQVLLSDVITARELDGLHYEPTAA